MSIEFCCECEEPTGNAGADDGSIYIVYPDKEIGPLCNECRDKHWVCELCGEAVYPINVTFDERHEGCGGICS